MPMINRLALVLGLTGPGCDRAAEHTSKMTGKQPNYPVGLACVVLRDTAFTWQTRETSHLRIHFQPGSYAADHIDQFVEDAEQARPTGYVCWGPAKIRPALKSKDQMKRITDYAVRGWTDPVAKTVLLVRASPSHQGERHEIAHLLSYNLWGHSNDWGTTGWMSEALATYAGGPCSGHSIDEIVAYIDLQSDLIPLDSLALKFRRYNDLIAYLQAGSLFGYIRETYGLAKVRALWDRGFEQFETTLSKSPSAVDAEWRKHLKASYPEPKVDWISLKKTGCQ